MSADAPTPLDLDAIRAMLGDRLAVTTRSVALDLLAEVKAEALREAGQDLPGEWSKQDRRKVERWLRSRPYRLAAEGGADRG